MKDMQFYDNMFMELYHSALKVARDLALVKKGERVLVLADTAIDREMIQSVAAAAYSLGAKPALVIYETAPEVDVEPPDHVAAAMKSSDVIISFPLKYILHTRAYIEALKAGSRILELTGMDKEMMIRLIGLTDYDTMCRLGDKLRELTAKARRVTIKTEKGTMLEFENDPSRPVFHNDGILREKGLYKPLGGQISWAPIEETVEGTFVVDSFIWPPDEIGVVSSPVKLKIKGGRIVEVTGQGPEASIFKSWLASFNDDKMYYIAHASWGFHPNARLRGIPLEDERIYATIEFGFGSQSPKFKGSVGSAAAHTDAGVLYPEVRFDGELIASGGRFVHPELAELDKVLKSRG
ncbi:MAG: hypothetical protein F7C07_04990 [Desulfurococcales archaeon]|nr:hypothetical protein [Desulfurococcales archaeon]